MISEDQQAKSVRIFLERAPSRVNVDPDTGCHIWGGAKRLGYGLAALGGKQYSVHRIAYIAAKGPIPEGLVIDHLCRNRACCNPDHLEAVSHRENTARGLGMAAHAVRHDRCVRGHQNWRVRKGRRGEDRQCVDCAREYQRQYQPKWRAKQRALKRAGAPA